MSDVRADHSSTLLPDGNVLVAGGMNGNTPSSALATAEIYDVRKRVFKPAGEMLQRRCAASATLLRNGNVLIAGGWTPDGVTAEAELYESANHRFVQISSMNVARAAHTATLLQDGRVLIAGGEVADSSATATAELYDPKTRRFSMTGALSTARSEHAAAALKDGRVLIVGGENKDTDLASAEIYDPRSGMFTPAIPMSVPRSKLAALTLENGTVLVAGGQNGGPRGERLMTAELYDPASNAFHRTGSMAWARYKIGDDAVLLRDGRALIAGGAPFAETYSAKSHRFSVVHGNLNNDRDFGAATLLRDGNVLITGGYTLSNDTPPELTKSALLYNAGNS